MADKKEVHRLMMEALRKDKKAAKDAKNYKRKEQHDLANQVAALAPPNLPSIDNILPQFKIGDRLYTIPDSSPGVDHTQAEAFYGSVFESKFDCTWHYNIKSIHEGRNSLINSRG